MFPEDLIGTAGDSPSGDPAPFRLLPPETDGTVYTEFDLDPPEVRAPLSRARILLHVALFLVTLFSTTLVGAHMMFNFRHGLPFLELDRITDVFSTGLRSFSLFLGGLPFSLTLLSILMAHELGHYFACLWYNVDATLPFFLPSPMPVTGTFGAFIRIRSAIPGKRALFDIGIAGPLAGFVFLFPALFIGLAFSRVLPGINTQGSIQLGVPALQWLAQKIVFPGVRAADIYLHPVARAAWVGMFATALNLLPAGQLDGGHIIYAVFGKAHKWITWVFLVILVPLGLLWNGWWFWAVLLLFIARRHPPIHDSRPLGNSRVRLAIVALAVFILCFTVIPVSD